MRGFGSDNHSGVHPELFKALQKCNVDHAPSYGTDDFSEQAQKYFKTHFGEKAHAYFVFNGTAANVLALRSIMQRHESILCSSVSHLNLDECGAPEFFAGKLIPLEHINGCLQLSVLKDALIRRGDQHFSQSKVVSLTQPTELGTCYSLEEIRSIVNWAHENNLFVHIDGARLANACYTLGASFKQMTTDLGVDIVSLGGTKNGFMMGEAIVVLNPTLAKDLKYIRKQSAQLPSKTRFIAAQFCTYFENNLFEKIAKHACDHAEILKQSLQEISQVQIEYPRQSNAVFARFPKSWIKPLKDKAFFYVWDEKTFSCRLMTGWDTTEREILEFADLAKKLTL